MTIDKTAAKNRAVDEEFGEIHVRASLFRRRCHHRGGRQRAHRYDLRLHRRVRDEDLLQAGDDDLVVRIEAERTMRSSSAKSPSVTSLRTALFSGPTT